MSLAKIEEDIDQLLTNNGYSVTVKKITEVTESFYGREYVYTQGLVDVFVINKGEIEVIINDGVRVDERIDLLSRASGDNIPLQIDELLVIDGKEYTVVKVNPIPNEEKVCGYRYIAIARGGK